MKAILVAALALVSVSAFAETPQEASAQKAYDSRDYSQPGRASAAEAVRLFGDLAKTTADANLKAQYLVKQAASSFFLGDSASDNNEKIAQFTAGMGSSNAALKLTGINDVNNVTDADIANITKRSKDEITLVAEALYVYGINLGQWGQANGVMQSLNKWPELRTTMELIVKVGARGLHEYGAYRTLGRGYFKIPALLGGDVAKAQKYLSTAVQGSLAPGQVYSTNGYNNLFYADLLIDQGQQAQAKKILQDFVKADPKTTLPGYEPETREAQRLALVMLKNL
jgi:hypothetical protein